MFDFKKYHLSERTKTLDYNKCLEKMNTEKQMQMLMSKLPYMTTFIRRSHLDVAEERYQGIREVVTCIRPN